MTIALERPSYWIYFKGCRPVIVFIPFFIDTRRSRLDFDMLSKPASIPVVSIYLAFMMPA